MPRVVGTDPGTGSLDLLLMIDGTVADQARLAPDADPAALIDVLDHWQPIDLIAGPSGYGLPLVRAENVTDREIALMTLVREFERGQTLGVGGFRGWVRALVNSKRPVVFLPGGVHLPTIPRHRTLHVVDRGTADKVAVAALALRLDADASGQAPENATFAVVEAGSAFTAVLVVDCGAIVDASAGTAGPMGLRSSGAWDGEVAYLMGPLSKADLFRGGLDDLGPVGRPAFFESIRKHVAGLRDVTAFDRLYLGGSAAERPDLALDLFESLSRFGQVVPLKNLPGAWVKHAAQGSALLADGLAGGGNADLIDSLRIRESSGSVLDGLDPRCAVDFP